MLSCRQDEEDSMWYQHASRPWDPPLSVKGRQEVSLAANPGYKAILAQTVNGLCRYLQPLGV